tara:strand:- start:160 stop:1305 length:1146 start_codon:yes stop_codon:yes gene_type:complete
MKKILFYTANGVGLGHLRRSSLIAESVKEMDDKIDISFLTMSQEVSFLDELGIPYIKLKHLTDDLVRNRLGFEKAKKFNEKKFLNLVRKYNPKIIVLDVYLFGFSFPEIILSSYFKNITKVLILRKKDKEKFVEVLENKGEILNNFQRIILPHSKSELEGTLSRLLLNNISKDPRFLISGPVFKKPNLAKIDFCRKKYKISTKDFLITVGLGGGGELKAGKCESPLEIIKDFLDIYPQLSKAISNLKVIISTGPYFSDFKKKFSSRIEFVKFEKNFTELIKLSDLVISTAGYNICNEIIQAKLPAILIPLYRGDREQFERAYYLEKKGIAKVFENGSPNELLKLIFNTKDNLDKMKLNFRKFSNWEQGNNKAAKEILDLLK